MRCRGTRTSPGQSVRGPPANPYRDDGGQALIRINAVPMSPGVLAIADEVIE
jgi:hypothetical protein